MKRHIFLIFFLLSCFIGVANANLISNGSFEFGTYSGAPFDTLTAGTSNSTAIDGWIVADGSIDWIGGYWSASEGNRSIDLAGVSNGLLIGAEFATIIGKTYTVEFDMAGNPDRSYDKTLIAAALDGVAQVFSFEQAGHTRSEMGWVTHSFSFIAQYETSSLSFGNLSDRTDYQGTSTAWGAALDNVSVVLTPVPEPATMMLFGIGLLGLSGIGRKKT